MEETEKVPGRCVLVAGSTVSTGGYDGSCADVQNRLLKPGDSTVQNIMIGMQECTLGVVNIDGTASIKILPVPDDDAALFEEARDQINEALAEEIDAYRNLKWWSTDCPEKEESPILQWYKDSGDLYLLTWCDARGAWSTLDHKGKRRYPKLMYASYIVYLSVRHLIHPPERP